MQPSSKSTPAFVSVIDRKCARQRCEFTGCIRLREMEDFVTDMARQGTTTFSKLLDARAATTDISAHDVQQIVGILERMAKGEKLGRAAIVVADNVSYGMARMMSALIEGTVSIHAFREIKEAEEWLGWDGEASSAAGSPAM